MREGARRWLPRVGFVHSVSGARARQGDGRTAVEGAVDRAGGGVERLDVHAVVRVVRDGQPVPDGGGRQAAVLAAGVRAGLVRDYGSLELRRGVPRELDF